MFGTLSAVRAIIKCKSQSCENDLFVNIPMLIYYSLYNRRW